MESMHRPSLKKWYFVSPFVLQTIAWLLWRPVLRVFGCLKADGLEHLKGVPGPFIFAPNHTSELDAILVRTGLPIFSSAGPMFYTVLSTGYYRENREFGWRRFIYGGVFFKAFGAYPMATGKRDYSKTLANHEQIIRDGGSVCIFPEGAFTRDGSLGEARGGVAYLSHATGVPIVPVGITGTFRLSLGDFLRGRRTILIRYGTPLYPQDLFRSPEFTDVNEEKEVATRVLGEVGKLLA